MKRIALASILLLGISMIFGATSELLTYQGKLTNTDGIGINGTYTMTFSFYNNSSGGALLWSEEHSGINAVNVVNGLFSVVLGDIVTLTGLDFNGQYYMEINIDGDVMSPRLKVTAEAYAFRAKYADNLSSGYGLFEVLSADSSTGNKTIVDNSDGMVDIGHNLKLADTKWLYVDGISPEGTNANVSLFGGLNLNGYTIKNTYTDFGGNVAFDDNIIPAGISNDLGDTGYAWDDIFLGSDSRININGDVGSTGEVLQITSSGMVWDAVSTDDVPSGSDGEIQINIGDSLDTDPYLKWDYNNTGIIIGDGSLADAGLCINKSSAFVHLNAGTFAGVMIDRGSSIQNGYLIYETSGTEDWYVGQIGYGATATNYDYTISQSHGSLDGTFHITKTGRDVGINTTEPDARLHVIEDADNYVKIAREDLGIYAVGENAGGYFYGNISEADRLCTGIWAEGNFTGTGNSAYTYGAYLEGNSTTQDLRGAQVNVELSDNNFSSYGVYTSMFANSISNTANMRGLYASTYSESSSGSMHGLYIYTSGSGTRWDGYFATGDIYVNGSCSGCDLAELFPAVEKYQPAMFVSLLGDEQVKLSDRAYDTKAVGIVSEQYSILIGNTSLEKEIRPELEKKMAARRQLDEGNENDIPEIKKLDKEIIDLQSSLDPKSPKFEANDVPVALIGRVPLNVTDESGMIKAGDLITTSNTPGHGMKVTKAGPYYAVALEDQKYSIDQILVKVADGYYTPSIKELTINSTSGGYITMTEREIWVDFDQDFASGFNDGKLPLITITPNTPNASLYVKDISNDGFRVVSNDDAVKEITFTWIGIIK